MIKVLLIDDSDSDRRLLLDGIQDKLHYNFEFIEAASLQAASKYATYRQFDIAVLDLFGVAPGKDGAETYHEFRRLFPNLAVLVLTGTDDAALSRSLVQAGADGYIVKGEMSQPQLMRELWNLAMLVRHRPRVPSAAAVQQRVSSSSQELLAASTGSDQTMRSMSETLVANGELGLVLLQKIGALEVSNAARTERMAALISDVKELKQHLGAVKSVDLEERRSHIELTKAERLAEISLRELQVKNRWELVGKIVAFGIAPTTGFAYLAWQWFTNR